MEIKVVYQSNDEGSFTAGSPVFSKCIGKGKTRGDALLDFQQKITRYITEVEKSIDKKEDQAVTNL